MKRFRKPVIIIAGIILFYAVGSGYSHIRYQRSMGATFIERMMWMVKRTQSQEDVEAILQKMLSQGEVPYEIPSSVSFDVAVAKSEYEGMQYYTLNGRADAKSIIVYLHGGAYVGRPSIFHWNMLSSIAKKTGAKILVPLYPLIPFHTFGESYDLLTGFYLDIVMANPKEKVAIMGDSAGGGLALGLCEFFGEAGITQPDALVLLSPWVDITMANEDIKQYEKVDPMLSSEPLIAYGKWWAGGADAKDYRISPMYGDLGVLRNVTLFVGTRELFYPDILKIYEMLKAAGVDCTLHVGKGQNHVYPCYPTTEGAQAVRTIGDIVNGM